MILILLQSMVYLCANFKILKQKIIKLTDISKGVGFPSSFTDVVNTLKFLLKIQVKTHSCCHLKSFQFVSSISPIKTLAIRVKFGNFNSKQLNILMVMLIWFLSHHKNFLSCLNSTLSFIKKFVALSLELEKTC